MERKEFEKIVKETIFEKMGEFTGLNHASEIVNEDELATDMAMDSLDYVEVVMEMERKTGVCILMRCLISSLTLSLQWGS